jgi:hypothetical protein
MKKTENLKAMLQQRVKDLDKQIFNFNPSLHVTYSDFDDYLDSTYGELWIGEYSFKPSKVLFSNSDAYFQEFKKFAETVDFEQIPEYIQLKDEREQTLDWLGEIA